MTDKISFSYLENRWREFWNFENHDRPLLSVTAPAEKPVPFRWGETLSLREQWLNADYVVACGENAIENTCFEGEAFPVFNPNLGPDLLGALCGCELEFAESTSWAKPVVDDWDGFPAPVFDGQNPWMEKIREITRKACEASQGRWLVGITDLHPGVDSLASLRGPQELCFDLVDSPEIFVERERQIFELYRCVFEDLTELVSRYQKGSTNWMGIWNPDRPWYVISADFSCMVSEKDYGQYLLPAVRWEAEFLPDNMVSSGRPGRAAASGRHSGAGRDPGRTVGVRSGPALRRALDPGSPEDSGSGKAGAGAVQARGHCPCVRRAPAGGRAFGLRRSRSGNRAGTGSDRGAIVP